MNLNSLRNLFIFAEVTSFQIHYEIRSKFALSSLLFKFIRNFVKNFALNSLLFKFTRNPFKISKFTCKFTFTPQYFPIAYACTRTDVTSTTPRTAQLYSYTNLEVIVYFFRYSSPHAFRYLFRNNTYILPKALVKVGPSVQSRLVLAPVPQTEALAYYPLFSAQHEKKQCNVVARREASNYFTNSFIAAGIIYRPCLMHML